MNDKEFIKHLMDMRDFHKKNSDRYEQALKKVIELPYSHDAIKSIVKRALKEE